MLWSFRRRPRHVAATTSLRNAHVLPSSRRGASASIVASAANARRFWAAAVAAILRRRRSFRLAPENMPSMRLRISAICGLVGINFIRIVISLLALSTGDCLWTYGGANGWPEQCAGENEMLVTHCLMLGVAAALGAARRTALVPYRR